MSNANAPTAGLLDSVLAKARAAGRAMQFGVLSIPDQLPLAASASQSPQIQVPSTFDFVIFAASGTSRDTGTGALQTDHPFTVQVNDAGSSDNLFDRAVDWDAIVGTAQNPAWWAFPRVIAASSTLTVTLTNLIATARNVRLSFWGVRIYGNAQGGWQ